MYVWMTSKKNSSKFVKRKVKKPAWWDPTVE